MRCLFLAATLLLASPAGAFAGTLTVGINGAGKVTGSGIDCSRLPGAGLSGPCEADIEGEATITAEPAAGFRFDRWTGACATAGATCTIPVASDSATNAAFVDVEAPVVTLAGGPVKGDVHVPATVADNGVVDRVVFKSRYGNYVDHDTPWEAPFRGTQVKDGRVAVTATAYDKAENSYTAAAEIIVDNTVPAVQVSGPDRVPFPPGSTQTWAIAATDAGSGIQRTGCSVVPNGERPVFVPCSSATHHSVSGLAVGRYAFTFRARDNAGNDVTETRFFRIETPENPLPESPLAPAPEAGGGAAAGGAPAARMDDLDVPRVLVALGFRFVSGQRATKLSRFVVRGVPAGATVSVRCPSGCARKVYAKTLKRGGRVSLKPLARRPLKVDTTVTVIVSKPGFISAVKVLTIRARKAPLLSTLCLPEGAPEPVAC